LIAERRKLFAQWRTNRRSQIQIRLKATTDLAKAVGLEALLDPLKGFREPVKG
jgi:hypothetical protein